jgi:hypothetical protein
MAKLDKSKYSYIDEKKLDDLYFTQFLREIWSVPSGKLTEYLGKFYPNPTALELVEIRQLISIVKKMTKNDAEGNPLPLTDSEMEILKYKHNRMFGKERQVIELSGQGGGPISVKDMSDEDIEKTLKAKLSSIAKAIKLSNKPE